MRKITRIGEHHIEGGLYRDKEGNYYVDGHHEPKDDGTIEVYILSPRNDPEGEPQFMLTAKLDNPPTERQKREHALEFEYMMLSRLIGDARGYFGTGDEDEDKWDCRYHNPKQIWGESIERLVVGIREYWDKLPSDLKPEWCTEDEIKKYEALVKKSE